MKPSHLVSFITIVCAVGGGAWYAFHQHPLSLANASQTSENLLKSQGPSRRAVAGPIAVVTAAATQADFPVRLHSIGNVEPIAVVAVKPRVQSQLLEQAFTEGQSVKKGDLLFVLDDREFANLVAKDEALLARDQAVVARTTADYQRAQMLLQRNAGTQQTLDQASSDQKSALATAQADQASLETDRLHLTYTKIFAPIDGRMGAVGIAPGNLVNASDSGPGLVSITQLKPIRVTFTLSERELPRLQNEMKNEAPLNVNVSSHNNPTAKSTGKLTFVDSSVDPASGTITLKAEFPNEDLALWPGEYVDVEVELNPHSMAISVPTVALQPGQNGDFVFLVGADSTAQVRVVTTGLAERDQTEVIKGLKAGDRVVIDGQLRLSNGSPVREADHVAEIAKAKD